MSFDDIQGNESVKQALRGMISSGKIPHAILFHEEDGGQGLLFCQAFLEQLMGPKVSRMTHLDVHYTYPVVGGKCELFTPAWRELVLSHPTFTEHEMYGALGIEGKQTMIAVAEAKAILDVLAFNALEGGYRAIVIYLPEKMNAETANRLLKSIEEPAPKTLFLLVTHAPEKVIPTIASRCQHIRLMPVSKVAENEYIAEEFALFRSLMQALLARDLGAALEVGDALSSRSSREKAKAFCAVAADALRAVFLYQQGMPQLVRVAPSMEPDCRDWATRCRRSFPRVATTLLDRTRMLVERNVNLKILFTDLVDKMYLNI